MTHWTIVPQRGLSEGKSRLAALLAVEERRTLNAMLLDRVLRSVSACEGGLEHCIVASADEATLDLARTASAKTLRDSPGADLNCVLEVARGVSREAGATSILVLAADLPFVSAEALRALRDAVGRDEASIIADKHGSGTNGLLLPAWLPLAFAFGAGSLNRHVRTCGELGLEPRVWADKRLAFDLDLPVEYLSWRSGGSETVDSRCQNPDPVSILERNDANFSGRSSVELPYLTQEI